LPAALPPSEKLAMFLRFVVTAMVLIGLPFTGLHAAGEVTPPAPVTASPGADIDQALNAFLAPEGDALILLPHRLDKNKLDFSVESLAEIDDWLQAIHTINRLEAGDGRPGQFFTLDGRGDNSVTFAALYLGEVVRQNSRQVWVWQPFDVFVANNPDHATQLGGDAGFDAYVLVSAQGVATPGNAALKRVLNGPIDSLRYIATFLIVPVDIDAAIRGTDFTALPPPQAPTDQGLTQ
jgi:hypothetical protein